MNKLHREVAIFPANEHKDFLKLAKRQSKAKSRVIRDAVKEAVINSGVAHREK